MQNPAEAEGGRLLRVLFLRGRSMPADSGSAGERQRDKLLHTGLAMSTDGRSAADRVGSFRTPAACDRCRLTAFIASIVSAIGIIASKSKALAIRIIMIRNGVGHG
jgi:hypothetical protein